MAVSESDERDSLFHEVKAARNQSLFREVNERIKEVGEQSASIADNEQAICECANDKCSERISVNVEEYQHVRERPTWFLVAASEEHYFPEVERVIESNERYWIVEKLDGAAVVAAKLDPRQRQGSP